MGLAKCISLNGNISKNDKDFMLQRSKELQSSGLTALEADRKVLRDLMDETNTKLASIKKEEINDSELSDDVLSFLNGIQEKDYDVDLNSIKRNLDTDRLEVKYGLRVDGKLKRFQKFKYKELLNKVNDLNKELKEKSNEHKAELVKLTYKNREYYGIKIIRTSAYDNNIFNSFKRTLKKTAEEVFGKTISGEIYIPNINIAIKNSVIQDITSELLDILRRADKDDYSAIKEAIEKQYSKVQKYYDELETALKKNPTSLTLSKGFQIIDTIKNNYDALSNMAIRSLSSINIINVNRNNIEDDIDDNIDDVSNLKTNNEDTTHWEAEGSIKIDSKKTIGKELKLFLTDVREYDTNGNVKKNIFGGRSLIPFDVVYNTLSRILSNNIYYGKNAYEQMIQEIENYIPSAPYLRDVVTKLRYEANNPYSKIPFQFIRSMIKHKVDMFYLGFSYKKEKGSNVRRFSIFPVDSNSSYNGKIISNNWYSNFKIGEYINIDEVLNDDVLNSENFKRLKNKARSISESIINTYKEYIKTLEKNKSTETTESLKNELFNKIETAFEILGITVSDSLIDDIINNRFVYFKKNIGIEALFNIGEKISDSGHYVKFYSSLNKIVDEPLSITSNPFNNKFIKALSEHESKYNAIDYSNSFLDQTGKSIYTYSNQKYLIERAIKLVDNPYVDSQQKIKLLEQLEKVPFISNSTWLAKLKRNALNSSNFKVKYADSIVNFNNESNKQKVKDSTIADIELYKLGIFMNRGFESNDNTVTTYVYPTLSDGGTIMEITGILEEILVNDNNTIDTGTLHKLYESIVVPEVNRILDFQSKGKTNLKDYDIGANKFLFLPKLNDESLGLFEDGKLKSKFEQEDLDNIYEVINHYVTNLIDNKISEWIDFGILKHSNVLTATIPYELNKKNLVTEKDIDNLHKVPKNASHKEIIKLVEGYDIKDVVAVRETRESSSLKDGYEEFEEGGSVYGIVVAPNITDEENLIKPKGEIIEEVRKFAKYASEHPEKLFEIKVQTFRSPSKNISGYDTYNLATVFANVKMPSNVVMQEKFVSTVLKAADNLREKTTKDLEETHNKAKKGVYKNYRLHFIDNNYFKNVFQDGELNINRPYYLAASYVINYMIANANIHQLFIGDPALYYRESNKENATDVDHAIVTFDNINKRLSADRAPGEFIADSFDPDEKYNQLILPDRILASEAEIFLKSLGHNYSKINATDSQEVTTLKEDLYVRYKSGMITKALYEALYGENGIITKELEKENYDYYGVIINNLNKRLKKEFEETINQPMKPVYVNNITQLINNQFIDRRIYIKSSSFALSPIITKNKQLDKLRIYMEKNNIARTTFASAVKVGDTETTSSINFFNDDGSINIDEELLNTNLIELPRDGFRIQQNMPFKEDKDEVKFGVQESILLFSNILNEVIDGVPVSELKKEYDEAYGELYKQAFISVYEELGLPIKDFEIHGFNKDHILNINEEKLSKLIYNEALNRGYSRNELEALGISKNKFKLRLAFHTRGINLESVLASIINNRVIKRKFKGKGFILASEEGFKYLEDKNLKDRIVYTKDIIEELKPMGFTDEEGNYVSIETEGAKFQPAQVFISSILRNENGTSIDLFEKDDKGKWKYLIQKKNRLLLNNKTVDPDILKIFGFRIPTQGHNGMTYIEIAGFLPKEAGDLIVAPRDFIKQMGSDFDVDKLFTYMYNVEVRNNKIKKVSSDLNTPESIKNKILDIHFKILSAKNKKIQKQIFEPLGFGILKSNPGEFLSNDESIQNIVNNKYSGNLGDYILNLTNTSDREFTGLSDMYQRDTFLEGRDGSIGIGVFTLNSILNTSIQNTNMNIGRYKNTDEGTVFIEHNKPLGQYSPNKLYNTETVHDNLKYDKSQVISWYQSASVDNAKEKILFKLNINNNTYAAIAYLNQVGYHEEVLWLINQPIVKDYIKQKQISSSSISNENTNIDRATEYVNKKYKLNIVKPIFKKYKNQILKDVDDPDSEQILLSSDSSKFTVSKLHSMLKDYKSGKFNNLTNSEIKSNFYAIDYFTSQLQVLDLFKEYQKYGNYIQNLQNILNSNSKGIGKTLSEAHIKANEIMDLTNSKNFMNADQLIGDYINQYKYDNLTEKEQKDYINVANGLYIKPTTIQGYASIYGTVASSYLFNSIFPYSSLSVSTAIQLINDISGSKSESITNRASNINKLWNEIKKFVNSKAVEDTSTYINYKRLLLDEFDGNERISYSLASIISEIRRNKNLKPKFKGNAFFDGLEIGTSKSSSKFSTIRFNNTVSDNLDDSLVYQGFSDLIVNEKSLGEFNGRQYTTKDLADDLITYSLIAGGVQQFNQFIKYVPFEYLEAIGYTDVINSINFEDGEVIGFKNTYDYTQVPEFVTQYFQHHPDQAPRIRSDSEFIISELPSNVSDINVFTINIEELKGRYNNSRLSQKLLKKRVFEEDLVPVEFISIYNYETKNSQLYKLEDSINGKYIRISTLGSKGISEYSYNNQFKDTYKTTIRDIDENKLIVSKDKSYTDHFINDTANTTTLGKSYNLQSGDIDIILDNIINKAGSRIDQDDQDRVNVKMATELKKLTTLFNVPIVINNKLEVEGRYIPSEKRILINDKYIAETQNSDRTFERVLLHEYLHAVTVRIAQENKNNPHFSSLRAIIEHTKSELRANNVDIDKLLIKAKIIGETESDNSKYLGLQNELEFISEFMTNPEFRDMLAGIKYQDKTIYDKVIEFIIDLINSFGLDIPKGTAAEVGFQNVVAIIDMASDEVFNEGLLSTRNPVKGKNVSELNFKTMLSNASDTIGSEEEYDSILRNLVNQGRLEIHCKL